MGGAVGTNIFLDFSGSSTSIGLWHVCTYWSPFYTSEAWPLIAYLQMAMNLAAIIEAVILRFAYVGINKRGDREDPVEIRQKYTGDQLLDMGDRSLLYRGVVQWRFWSRSRILHTAGRSDLQSNDT